MKRSLLLLVIALAVVLGASSAFADQITLGDSCTGTISVSPTTGSNPTVTGPVSGCNTTFEQGATNTIIGNWSLNTAGTGFAIASDGTNALTGTIDWTNSGLTGSIETIVGTLLVSTVSGFGGEIHSGGTYSIDIETNGATGGISGGEIEIPEPATLTLLGTGLIAMAGFFRRKLA